MASLVSGHPVDASAELRGPPGQARLCWTVGLDLAS